MSDLFKSLLPPEREESRFRRYLLGSIIFLALALAATHIFLQRTSVGSHRFVWMTLLVYGGTFLVVLALLILATILGRNLIKLYFEKKSGKPGSGLKTKLVRTFIGLALLPALLLFILAYTLINSSIEKWFLAPSAQMLEGSNMLTARYYADTAARAGYYASVIAGQLEPLKDARAYASVHDMSARLDEYRQRYDLRAVRLFDATGQQLLAVGPADVPTSHLILRNEMVAAALRGQRQFRFDSIAPRDPGDEIVYAAAPLHNDAGLVTGVLLTEAVRPDSLKYWAERVDEAADKYEQLRDEQTSLRYNLLLMLVLLTLLVIFAFAWFALYLSKRITVPLAALMEGAAAVAAGNLTNRVHCKAFDELEVLVASFNRMTDDLEKNEKRIAAARAALQRKSAENADRRRYIETILQTIATGVIALDDDGGIRAMNRSAMRMLQTREFNRDTDPTVKIGEIIAPVAREALRELMRRAGTPGAPARNLELAFPEKTLHLTATVTPLAEAGGQHTSWVICLEDLTELHQMEKAAAWREVAQRLAHEIKNPLTPIRLSAERVLYRYKQLPVVMTTDVAAASPDGDFIRFGQLLADCVQSILQETDSLKELVDEFSRFARLPETRYENVDLHQIIENSLQLYDGQIANLRIVREFDPDLPRLRLDPEQMKRVFINLFDNAITAMTHCTDGKTLRITTFLDRIAGAARIEISDNGCGIPADCQEQLFVPYFSTRAGGTGLGLAIVRRIIADHHGCIRAEVNAPAGTRIVIDLPLRHA